MLPSQKVTLPVVFTLKEIWVDIFYQLSNILGKENYVVCKCMYLRVSVFYP